MNSYLYKKYKTECRNENTLPVQNIHCIPVLKKISVSICLGKNSSDKKYFSSAVEDLSMITGQKPIITMAKKSIASFQLREGQTIGAYVTLRKKNMFHFLEKLVFLYLPRNNELVSFSSKSIDSNNNFSIGIKSSSIFHEALNSSKNLNHFGLNISFNIKANSSDESIKLLKILGIPIK
jgi:large subunit ribosomal protein L5